MTTTIERARVLSDQAQERASRIVIPAVRIIVGLLWLQNAGWKTPPDFGKRTGRGLFGYTQSAVTHEVFAPYAFFVKHVVLKNFTFFGWVTLLVEASLGAFLILGLHTRLWALIGLGQSLAITFSVLHVQNEWPWSYYLMIAAHLALFALDAGNHWGLDDVRRRLRSDPAAWTRPAIVVGAITVVIGATSFVKAGGHAFGASFGTYLGPASPSPKGYELSLMAFNRRGALIVVLLGLALLTAGLSRARVAALAASLVAALLAVLVLFQFNRNPKGVLEGGFLGGNGSTLSFLLGLALAGAVIGGAATLRRGMVSKDRPVTASAVG